MVLNEYKIIFLVSSCGEKPELLNKNPGKTVAVSKKSLEARREQVSSVFGQKSSLAVRISNPLRDYYKVQPRNTKRNCWAYIARHIGGLSNIRNI